MFCIFLGIVLDTLVANCENSGIPNAEKSITIMAHVDDVVMVFQQQLLQIVWANYVSTLQQFNLVVDAQMQGLDPR